MTWHDVHVAHVIPCHASCHCAAQFLDLVVLADISCTSHVRVDEPRLSPTFNSQQPLTSPRWELCVCVVWVCHVRLPSRGSVALVERRSNQQRWISTFVSFVLMMCLYAHSYSMGQWSSKRSCRTLSSTGSSNDTTHTPSPSRLSQ